jgi:hypothetical protein
MAKSQFLANMSHELRPHSIRAASTSITSSTTFWTSQRSMRVSSNSATKKGLTPGRSLRTPLLSIHEGAPDLVREIVKTEAYQTSRYQREKVEMLFAHLKRILKLDRLRLRGPNGARDEFHLAATAQNLRKLAKLIPSPTLVPVTRLINSPATRATAGRNRSKTNIG